MRRITLALALLGAVAAAGCSSSSSNDSAGSGAPVKHGDFSPQTNPALHVAAFMSQCQTPKAAGAYTCTACHGANLLGGAGPSCATCHAAPGADACGSTHSTDGSFINPMNHGQGWISNSSECRSCHGADTAGTAFAPACNKCHGMPHTPGGYSSHAPDFLVQLDAISATTVISSTSVGFTVSCTGCHGSGADWWKLQGAFPGYQAPSCAKCHAYPTTGHFAASGHNSGVCARCHTGDGFRDLIGADGSTVDVLNVQYGSSAGAATQRTSFNSGFRCNACHNGATVLGGGSLNQHKFPSGNVLTLDGKTAICAQCHDGGRPGYEISQVAAQLAGNAGPDAQLATTANKTVRAHYFPAASTLYGKEAANWAQYAGMNYTGRNDHGGQNGCVFCHDAHTGDLPADGAAANQIGGKCGVCHFNEAGATISTLAELQETRQFGFEGDIDGNGAEESLQVEINGLGSTLYQAIQAYAANVSNTPICNPTPTDNKVYVQANTTDACGTGANATAYNKFTPRLLNAVYNFLMYQQDPGTWAHNPRYTIEVLFDAITDLNAGLTAAGKTPVLFSGKRSFDGHFGAADAATPYAPFVYHGAPQGFTSAACYQCHGGQGGFGTYLAGAPAALTSSVMTPGNKVTGMQCGTCHALTGADMKTLRSDIAAVYFPPQKEAPASQNPSMNVTVVAGSAVPEGFALCGSCHSGRESMQSVLNKLSYSGAATGGTATTVTFRTAPVTFYGKDAFKGALLTFTSGALNGTAVTVTGTTAGTTSAPDTTLTFATQANVPAAGDTFTVAFDDTTFKTSFLNPHYLGAAGVMMGTDAKMLFEYPGKTYSSKPIFWNPTTSSANGPYGSPHGAKCIGCHNPLANPGTAHSFVIDLNATVPAGKYLGSHPVAYNGVAENPGDTNAFPCAGCHSGAYALSGPGRPKEEFEAARDQLYAAIQSYAAANSASTGVAGICYNAAANPYFFNLVGGVCQDGIANAPSTAASFGAFNAKLLKAAFNYQWTQKEPGAWAHNEYYVMQVIYDSIVDLGGTSTFMVNASPTGGSPLNRP
jgi:hypothetical protein